MFDQNYFSYKNIISNIAILGYPESEIINRGINIVSQLELTCLFSYPEQDESSYNQMTYEMMFPDKNYTIECPKFFSLSLTDELGNRSYLYCLKFPEKYIIENFKHPYEISVPIVICIKSNKSDLEPFRQLLTSINQIIVSDNIEHGPNIVNDYKKVELLNIFYFIFSLPHTPPHSLVRLKLNNDLCEVEKEIDFYFSSNCEIPCNKNDTDINLLFLILDQSIIIKVIIAILQEKQIIFRASQAYILHLIIPTFLKLIFPFKWQQSLVTILPNNEAEDYLDTPGSFIFGILSNALELNEIIEKYPGKIIVDCDTNEIFGEETNEPFVPEKSDEEKMNFNNTIKRKKDKFVFNNVDGDIKQGKNIFIVDDSYIYQYDPESNTGKGRKMRFNNKKNNIIIDTQNSQLLIHKNNDFITNSEIKSLRKNIQLVRNPEIFDIENIGKKDNNDKKAKEYDSLILPNRPFSYNIQNILLHFYLTKIADKESKFMEIFKKSNLYADYLSPKKFQNNSGKKIIENIKETIDNQNSIENCFIIEYNKSNFSALLLIDDIDKKISKLKNENTINVEKLDEEIYKELKTILINYCTVLGIKINNSQNKIDFTDLNSKKTMVKASKNIIKRGHVKSNNSLLQFTINRNTAFNLAGVDKSSKDYFKFYKKDGFLNFINNMSRITTREGKKPGELHQIKIFKELFNKFKELDNIFMDQKKEEEENEVIIDVLNENVEEEEKEEENEIIENGFKIQNKNNNEGHNLLKIDKKKLLEELQCSTNNIFNDRQLSMIDENEESVNNTNDSFFDKSIRINDNKEQDNLGNIIMNSLKSEENLINIKENEEINSISNSENIIIFPENEDKISKENDNFLFLQLNNNKNIIETDNLTQYYLFLAFYLEEISFSEDLLNKFDKEIAKAVGIQINIYKLILKLYKEAYKKSGEKHRDFPYYNFYSFLQGLNDKNLAKIEEKLTEDDSNFSELLEICQNVMNKRNIKLLKERKNTNNNIISDRAKSVNPSKYHKFDPNLIEPKDERISQKSKIFANSLFIPIKEGSLNSDFTEAIIINQDFESSVKPDDPLNMLYLFCISMQSVFPSDKDIQTKSVQQIIDDVNVDSGGFREFLAELKNIDLNQLKTETDKLCFWLNCFNFLLLFAIFYLKAYNLGIDVWENFFKNIQYNIGGNNYSLDDMLYSLFRKKIFFTNTKYYPKNYVKKNSVNFSKEKNTSQDIFLLLPLLLYIPTKEFFKLIIYVKSDLQAQLLARLTTIILTLILWNEETKTLSISGLLLAFDPNFINKGYSKYKDYFKNNIYKVLKGKKYKKMAIKQIKWELSFDNLLEYKFIEE